MTPSGAALPRRSRLIVEIVSAYASAWRELRRAPIEEVVARMRRSPAAPDGCSSGEVEEARRLGWIVVRTLAFLPGDTRCLRRSLVLTRLLSRRGIPARFVIAVRSGPDFLAHAWVECDGQPVLTPLDDSFGRLVEL